MESMFIREPVADRYTSTLTPETSHEEQGNGHTWDCGEITTRVVSALEQMHDAVTLARLSETGGRPSERDTIVRIYRPRTSLGEVLLRLRRFYVESGEQLLSWDEIESEVERLRGGLQEE